MTKRCYYCSSIEHDDTVGIASVLPKYEDKWFCSTFCLCSHKEGGLRMKRKKSKPSHSKRDVVS